MILTLKELASYLRVHERTVLRMLKSGQIQGTKIGGQWRFNSSQIDGLFFADAEAESEEVPLSDFTRSHLGHTVSGVLDPSRMAMALKAKDTEGVIGELVCPATFNALILDLQDLRSKILAREKLLSTGIGAGVAIPHPRDPVPTLSKPAVMVFGRSGKGVDFKAMDGKKVHLFFVLCCQNIELHLHLMGRLAKLLRNEAFVPACRKCKTPDDVLRLVLEYERQQAPAGS